MMKSVNRQYMMILFLLIYNMFLRTVYMIESATNDIGICVVILSQINEYHEKLYKEKENHIVRQIETLQRFPVNIFKSYSLTEDDAGQWTIFPLLANLSLRNECKWVFFLEELTTVNLEKLIDVLQKYNSSEELFVGYALQDNDPTIIHHFANPASLLYPHFSAGFFVSLNLIQKLAKLPLDDEYSFSIDPKYEFAKFVWDSGNGVKLQHENQFCLSKNKENCATWIEEEFPDCGMPIASSNLYVAVKTCHKFHHDRIQVVKETWASEVKNLHIFSDKEDESIPTVKVNIENVAHGHCEKTLSIIKYYINNKVPLQWLAIVDDDTIISVNRLRKLLSCYNASDNVALGERYGYGVANSLGYDYITGGGGMIFSFPALQLLMEDCYCPSIDSPDDMIIGMCLKRLGIPVIHSPYFHQARPIDYSPEFLKPFKHVSFHKHWMIDPYLVYQEWLQNAHDDLHTEL